MSLIKLSQSKGDSRCSALNTLVSLSPRFGCVGNCPKSALIIGISLFHPRWHVISAYVSGKTQSSIRKSYWHHIENNILGDKNEENFGETQKKFWKHVKSVKRDRTGTAPLKENGLLVSDSKSKARILNHQYQSVFSKEDSADIPEPNECTVFFYSFTNTYAFIFF